MIKKKNSADSNFELGITAQDFMFFPLTDIQNILLTFQKFL